LAGVQRLLQRIEHEVRMHGTAHAPSHDAPGKNIDIKTYRQQVNPQASYKAPGAPTYIAALQLAARCNMEQQKPAETSSGVFSVNDFCQWASIGRTAVYAELKAGRLTARKFGRRTIIPVSEAEKWLASLPVVQGRHSH